MMIVVSIGQCYVLCPVFGDDAHELPALSSTFSYKSLTNLALFTVSGMQSVVGNSP